MALFEWDADKSAANLLKHGLTLEEAALIFEGPVLSWTDERFAYGEVRTVSIGLIGSVVAITAVHTDRAGVTRIISARLASKRERKLYDEHF